MCGIAGIVHPERDHPVDADVLCAMRDLMTHRGPDDAGIILDNNAGLAHRRLSIIDLSERGHQPMSTQDGRYHIVYNGEIYNYLELRQPLEADGIRFRSNTDTEVLLHLFAREGASMLDKLNGMFAFAVWDTRDRSLFLARDRLGIKPLYYANTPGFFAFASEIKAFIPTGLDLSFDENSITELLLFRYVAGERTVFRNVSRLLPGHFLRMDRNGISARRWWNWRGCRGWGPTSSSRCR